MIKQKPPEDIIQRMCHNMYTMSHYLTVNDLVADLKADMDVLANELSKYIEDGQQGGSYAVQKR